MSQVHLDYQHTLNEAIEKWVDTLTSNNDDYVYVDGEEGDFGIVRYFGTDVDGNNDQHMMTEYIHGGDIEHSYYTLAGADMVQKIMRENFETALRKSLEASLDPGRSGDLFPGFVADFKSSERKIYEEGKGVSGTLHQRWEQLFPDYIEDRSIYRYGHRLFQAVVIASLTAPAQISFQNVIDPREFIAIKLRGKFEGTLSCMISHEGWKRSFVDSMICVIRVNGELPEFGGPVRVTGTDFEVVG
jgi:hypothetical protein